ncbi:hypothetical protein BLNAU_7658 [Blattamonas nauphoetae]|uniref:SPRY domain-containing protein n=1 Tax=Blattamonas nauphoetae TaxID=2049346 RepID=A0ABQ9Y0M8_9EUKA|nr:hypothetical protein BLNAU_7658 [Blattamonas nauphoetae]
MIATGDTLSANHNPHLSFQNSHRLHLSVIHHKSPMNLQRHSNTVIRLQHTKAPKPLSTLPLKTFSRKGHFSIARTILTRTEHDDNIVVGLMDSNNPIPAVGEILGIHVKNSVGFSTVGHLTFNTPSSDSYRQSTFPQIEGDCVRMEVDLDSTPRTVQFFVNGEAFRFYISGIPSSVRIGCSVIYQGTSIRIDNISHISQPTPMAWV